MEEEELLITTMFAIFYSFSSIFQHL